MKPARRTFLQLAAGAAALAAAPRIARAQAYPARPVRLVVGFAAGGGTDIAARLTGQWLSARLGQPFIIENRPGAGSSTAAEVVANAAPDGYTLLVAGLANAVNATLYTKLTFRFPQDFVPVAGVLSAPNLMVVHPSFPARTVPEFIAYAKANPSKVNMGSAGVGSGTHMSGELFKMLTGLDLPHVPYRGAAPALADLLAAQLEMLFADYSAIEHVRSGRLRALAVTTVTRSPILPDVPAMNEFVPGYEANGWYGVVAPRNTPAEIADKLNGDINAILADPKLNTRFADLGATALVTSRADFGTLMADETEKWAKVVKFSGAKAD
jgi:tripartite-type tricarboxylate transporter receptor subunit TctC